MSKKTSHDSDVSFIQALAELLRENDLTELRVKRDYAENDSLDVRVGRYTQAAPVAAAPVPLPPPQKATTRRAIPALSHPRWSAPFICHPNPARRLSRPLAKPWPRATRC